MAETHACPKCGVQLPSNAPAGICPKCLMMAGLDSDSQSGAAYFASQGPFSETPSVNLQPPAPEELADRFGQFEVLELLGYGGMGAVYKAQQKSLDRPVALKIIRSGAANVPGFAERFSREAKALARLSHPSIVTVYDFGENDGLYYLVMEYVDGVNLRQTMQAGPLEPGEALQIVPQICDALQYAHDEGIVHRDVKPENILIDKRGRVKIADFGLAKLVGGDTIDPTLTATRQVMGTIRYMAPEQMESSRSVDHRADIYSLGVVFYEMLTGETPIGHFEPPSKKVQLDVRLDEVVLRALASEPERRFQRAEELKSSVEDITSHPDVDNGAPARAEVSERNAGMSTIIEREVGHLHRWFAAEPNDDARRQPVLPVLLMIVLSFAGCSMILLPWLHLEIDQNTILVGRSALLEQAVSQTIFGSERWPGVVTAALFVCFAVLLIVTPGSRRPGLFQALLMTAIAAITLFQTYLFFAEFETSGRIPLRTAADSTLQYEGTMSLSAIDHRTSFQSGFYGSLGLSLALLVLSATGVRHAIVSRTAGNRVRKAMAAPDKPRFSRKAIVGACWAAISIPNVLIVALLPLLIAFLTRNSVPTGTTGTVAFDFLVMIPLSLPALLAPFGTTTLGLLALRDIRRSNGQLRGLRLAFFDAVVFPTLLLDILIVAVVLAIKHVLIGYKPVSPVFILLISVPLALLVDIVLIRLAWLKAVPADEESTTESARPADSAAPLTSVRFSIPEQSEIGPTVVFHFTDLGYRLIGERPQEWIFQRGKKWACLLGLDIRSYHTTLTVRAIPHPHSGLIVSCAWAVTTYGGPVFGRSIAKLEAEAHELESLLRLDSIPPSSSPTSPDVVSQNVTSGVPDSTIPSAAVQPADAGNQLPASSSASSAGRNWVTLTRQQAENGWLPDVCLVCGRPATEHVGKTFTHTPDWTALLFLCGVLPGLIAAFLTEKKMQVGCPVCREHRHHWNRLIWAASLGWLLMVLLGLVGYAVGVAVAPGDEDPQVVGAAIGVLIGLVCYVGPVIYLACTRVASEWITDDEIRLKRVSTNFTNAVSGRPVVSAPPGPPARRSRVRLLLPLLLAFLLLLIASCAGLYVFRRTAKPASPATVSPRQSFSDGSPNHPATGNYLE